ncbi:DUF6668 family protein [Cellulomonas sp. 179-A 9B4 NHS]|uniref:DUF6668 family protein n=1 Tax=Cellulomonas sp. 179-A 9B4 NHS TaxID=3142379 RepID=UPI0039A39331
MRTLSRECGVTDADNPWLSRPVAPQPSAPAYTGAPTARPTGPSAPQRGVPAPDRAALLPTIDQRQDADLWWLGAHGGAGETSLAALIPGWPAAGHGWPRTPGAAPARVVVTARSSMSGLRAAQTSATQWAAGLVPHVQVLGLVLIADAPGRLPRPLREFAQVVAGGFARTWTLPWIEAWRLGEPPALTAAPREVRRLVDELSALLRPGADGTAN